MTQPARLVESLAGRGSCPRHRLATRLGCSRSELAACEAELLAQGLPLARLAGDRLALEAGWLPLDAARLEAALPLPVELHWSLDSTSDRLQAAWRAGLRAPRLVVAEHQGRGRGRRGRAWAAPPMAGLWASVLWRLPRRPEALPPVAQLLGVAVAGALRDCGVPVGLKWPNDLQAGGRKLGGLLVEVAGREAEAVWLVCGIGINYRMPPRALRGVDQPWTDVRSVAQAPPARQSMVERVLGAAIEALERAPRRPADWLAGQWQAFDALAGRRVRITTARATLVGRCRGVGPDGGLLVEGDEGVARVTTSEATLRVIQ